MRRRFTLFLVTAIAFTALLSVQQNADAYVTPASPRLTISPRLPSPHPRVSASPHPRVSLSLHRRVTPSPHPLVSPSPSVRSTLTQSLLAIQLQENSVLLSNHTGFPSDQ